MISGKINFLKHAAIILSYSGKATFVKPILKVLYQKKVPVIYVGKSGGNLYPQYVTCALTISGRENLRDRIQNCTQGYCGCSFALKLLITIQFLICSR